jgi:hypothetical protein
MLSKMSNKALEVALKRHLEKANKISLELEKRNKAAEPFGNISRTEQYNYDMWQHRGSIISHIVHNTLHGFSYAKEL